MNRRLAVVVTLLLAAGSLSACGSTSNPIPQSKDCTAAGVTCEVPAAPAAPVVTEEPVAAADPAAAEAAAAPVATTCDVVKEALLTGTPNSVKAALKALIVDRKADGTAREYAQNYLVRDRNSKDLRSMDLDLIKMSCP